MIRYIYKKINFLLSVNRRVIWTVLVKYRCAEAKGFVRANFKTQVTARTYLGHNINFNGMIITGAGRVDIGDNFHSGKDCLIISSYHNYDNGTAIPYDDTYIHKDVIIEENVWLGNRVIILGGVTIGEGAIIQAGSCITSNIPSYAIAGGHPAKVFKYRDIEHYNRLKKEGSFF